MNAQTSRRQIQVVCGERPDATFNMILLAGICAEDLFISLGQKRYQGGEAAPSKVLAEQTRGRIQKEGSARVKLIIDSATVLQ